MKKIRDATTIIGMLEDGELAQDLSAEIDHVREALRDAARPKGKVKGYVALKIAFTVEGVSTVINAEITSQTPKKSRQSTFLFITDDGFSDEHPKQIPMFPEDAAKRRFND